MDWFDYEHIWIDDTGDIPKGIRQFGRFLLVDKAEHLYAKIKRVFQDALLNSNGILNVHICSGICGGTGSGIFLDICYLVREALRELGKPETSVCGYFFLPDVNLSVPVIAADPRQSEFISVNGFAALKELDYCMNFSKNRDSFRMNYGFRTINDAQKPVDLCYLISTTDQIGGVIKNGYDYAMGVVTEFIINFLIKRHLPLGVDVDGIALKGHLAPLKKPIDKMITLSHGGIADYNVVGIVSAEIPMSEIATYLGYKLFESYSDLYDRMPTEIEREQFLVSNQLKYEDIRKALTKGCPSRIDFPKRFDARMFKERGNVKFVEFADEYFVKNKGEMEKNSKTFLEETSDFIIPESSTSLIGRTYKGLCDKYITQLEYGPFFAQRMLYGTQNQNLIHAVDGFIAENQANLKAEVRQNQLRNDAYEAALLAMQNANFINANSRLEAYLNALNNLYVHHYKVEMYQTMDMVLRTYREQLSKLNNNFFHILTTVLDTLRETFAENGKVLTQGIRTTNSYSWKILSVPDVQSMLDEEVRKIDLRNTLHNFMQTMMDNCKKWINVDENEITKLVSDFVLTTFHDTTQKTITDYLKIKFNAPSQCNDLLNLKRLAWKTEWSIIEKELAERSIVLFWKNHMYHNSVRMNSILTVPYDAAEIKMAAKNYAINQPGCLVSESSETDRISLISVYSGIQMHAYQGILELQYKYEKDTKPGRHLYERGKVDWNKWLPSPIPESFRVGISIPRIEERNKALLKEFETAEALGIVTLNESGHWEIQQTEEFNVEAYIEQQGGYITNGKNDSGKIGVLVEALKTEQQRLSNNAKPVRIECIKANAGSERQVMLDFYLMSPVLNNILKEELKKYEDMRNKIEELKPLIPPTLPYEYVRKDFFNAIFTGVLSYGNTITYTYDECGIEKVVVLQDNDMEFGDTGAYQGYLTYKGLDKTIKKKIVTETKLRMSEEDNPNVRAAVVKLEAYMPKRINRYNILHDATDPIHDELEEFYIEFMKAFRIFEMNFS